MDFLRRSLLFLPGDNPRFLTKALDGEADAIILDIEDAVAPHQKPAARLAVAAALRTADFGGKEKLVRINALFTPYGREDVEAVVPARPHTLMVPKSDGILVVQELENLGGRVGFVINNPMFASAGCGGGGGCGCGEGGGGGCGCGAGGGGCACGGH